MVTMLLCGASMMLAIVIMLSSFHLGRPGKRLALLAGVIAMTSLAVAWRVAKYVEASNAVRADGEQLARQARRVDADLRELATSLGAPVRGDTEQLLVQIIAHRAQQELALQNRAEAAERPAIWAQPDPLSKPQVLVRLNRIYAAKLPAGEDVIVMSEPPVAWLNQQLVNYGFDWRVREGKGGKLEPILAVSTEPALSRSAMSDPAAEARIN